MEFSVIITVYNRTDFLREAIKSALDQQPQPEVVVMDDASGEGPKQVIHRIVEEFPAIKLILQPRNLGVSAARNEGLKHVEGDYVVFLDDDDILISGCFDQALQEINGSDVLLFKSGLFSDDERSRRFRRVSKLHGYLTEKIHMKPVNDPKYFLVYTPALHAVVFRRSLFYHFQFSESLDYGEDRLLLMQMRDDGLSFKRVDQIIALYRIHKPKSQVNEAIIFLKLLQASGLLKTRFEWRYLDLLYAYFSFGKKQHFQGLRYLMKAITSVGVLAFLGGLFLHNSRELQD